MKNVSFAAVFNHIPSQSQRPVRAASQAASKANVDGSGSLSNVHKEKRKRADSVNTQGVKKSGSTAARASLRQSGDRDETERQPQKKAKVGNPRPAKVNDKRPYKAAIINESDSDLPAPQLHPRRASKPQTATVTGRPLESAEDTMDDDGEDADSHGNPTDKHVDEEMSDDELVEEQWERCDNFEAERVTISKGSGSQLPPTTDDDAIMVNDSEEEDEPGLQSNYYERRSDASPHPSDELDEDEFPVVTSRGQRQLTEKQRAKLKTEVPVIRPVQAAPKATVQSQRRNAPAHATATAVQVDNSADDDTWLPRTRIDIIENPQSVKINLRAQDEVMKQVIRYSYTIGDQMVVFGRKDDRDSNADLEALTQLLTPMDKAGLDQMALEALVQAADALGYTGERDVADRLERGSYKLYIRPLTVYVAHRLGQCRTAIKRAVTPCAEHMFQLVNDSADGVHPIPDKVAFLKEMCYIYPWTPADGFDRRALYEGPLVKSAVRSAFFGNAVYLGVGSQNIALCPSSMRSVPLEYEVPPEMVALAMTAVESVIMDAHLKLVKGSEFGASSAPVYREHMIRLAELRQQRPKRYHRVMHEIFEAATGGHGLNTGIRIGGSDIDWNAIPDE
ncbi:uncharacterized protein C8Q71DRAFT_848893 [Rhodofomes roseus]|uniref:DUF6532 domain-containing protein n=1 Tax=Rhodofomes roseus TaxID=34475 RepID=A0ABQ8KCC8_9APHY|nr:uncharacterized protein C8Q71DRAFT_848893 [Rhodofomes roseus]KAH9835182.1 hypothetical protein C8Q71DRAFT_848893 [Rhodofomes roseus]